MERARVFNCPYCQGLGRVGDDLECRFCAGTGKVVHAQGSDPEQPDKDLPAADVDLLSPAEVDRVLTALVGPDWRTQTFDVEVPIGSQIYKVARSTERPNELHINGRALYSDLWG